MSDRLRCEQKLVRAQGLIVNRNCMWLNLFKLDAQIATLTDLPKKGRNRYKNRMWKFCLGKKAIVWEVGDHL